VDLAKPRMASRGGRLNKIKEEFGSPPAVSVRSGEVVSALVNLIVNAIDAMPNGGTVTLRTRAARDGAEIDIEDDGPGMPKEVADRIFEPFFTTKGDAGTGLGLAMVVDCVQRHGGTLALATKPGQGTKFTLWIPAAS
jgi:signal transduction histidine kinase